MRGTLAKTGLAVWASLILEFCALGCKEEEIEGLSESWRIGGVVLSDRGKGAPDDWIANFNFGERNIERLVHLPVPAPDGFEHGGDLCFAYNESLGVIACSALVARGNLESFHVSMWTYDVKTQQVVRIGGKQWKWASAFAWSPDAKRLAFTATSIFIRKEPARGEVYVYDPQTAKVAKVADDGMVGAGVRRTPAPVWSEDGEYLYYASIGRDATRVNLNSLVKERLPLVVHAILTVKAGEIVYVQEEVESGEFKSLIMKCGLSGLREGYPPDAARLYDGAWLEETLVSPSRRFILVGDRRSYWGGYWVLIDTQTCKTCIDVAPRFPDRMEWPSTCALRGN
jgi:hypothetical protein